MGSTCGMPGNVASGWHIYLNGYLTIRTPCSSSCLGNNCYCCLGDIAMGRNNDW